MWCPFHNEETRRPQKQQIGVNERPIASSRSRITSLSSLQALLLPGGNLEGQGISFAAVDVPTRDEPTKEQGFGPFCPTDEPVASFDTSGWFSGSGGTNSEEAVGSTFEIKEGRVQRLGLWSHIIDTLPTLARALVMAVLLHYVWLTFDSPMYNPVASTNNNGQPETYFWHGGQWGVGSFI